ncbi:hypothetical protein [Pseudoduganella rhizocola]|uniref:hypothetical protein n=1 Tax=Pseudoduganella rhizocola TaxID=3382643 RepID=UPI0038B435C2
MQTMRSTLHHAAVILAACGGFWTGQAYAQAEVPTQWYAYGSPSPAAPRPSLSGDGRYVAFKYVPSGSSTLSPGNILVYDAVTGGTEQADVSPAGAPSSPNSEMPVISGNGRFVIFISRAADLGVPASNGSLFIRDRQLGTTELVATNNINRLRNNFYAGINSDGRYVVYRIEGGNTGNPAQLYIWDRITKVTEALPIPDVESVGIAERINISSDGRYISYAGRSLANVVNLYVYDRSTGTREIVNVNTAGEAALPAGSSRNPTMSDDGKVVAFQSTAINLSTPNETKTNNDIFVRDRAAGTTERISFTTASLLSIEPSISADGRYVIYQGYAASGGPKAVWLYDRLAKASRGGLQAYLAQGKFVENPVISADGRYVALYATTNGSTPLTRQLAILDFGPPHAVQANPTSLQLIEGGVAGTYGLTLNRAPSTDVTVSAAGDAQITWSPAQITFTAANWDLPQQVTVHAIADNAAEPPQTSAILHTVSTADVFFKVAKTSVVHVVSSDPVPPVVIAPGTPGQPLQSADVTLNGSAAPGATVLLTLTESASGNVQAVSVAANGEGQWLYTFLGLANGGYTVSAEADGIQGNTVAFSVYVQRDQQ